MTVPLPPLPPAMGGGDEVYRPGGRSMIDVLGEEHEQMAALCAQLTDPGVGWRRCRQVAEVVTAVVARHLSAEEQYLYPALRQASPGGARLADREIVADVAMLRALKELAVTPTQDDRFGSLAAEVADQVRRHARAAAADLFPALRDVATEADLIRLGNRVEIAEETAPTRPHPATPATPPWNKVVEPALGVVDKVRDAVTGRRTYVEDLSWRPRMW